MLVSPVLVPVLEPEPELLVSGDVMPEELDPPVLPLELVGEVKPVWLPPLLPPVELPAAKQAESPVIMTALKDRRRSCD